MDEQTFTRRLAERLEPHLKSAGYGSTRLGRYFNSTKDLGWRLREGRTKWTVYRLYLICRELQLSRSTLFAILSDSDITFASHIRELRLERCFAQIRDPRRAGTTIGDIARRAGFASQESFTRAFRRRYGAPPGRYRTKD